MGIGHGDEVITTPFTFYATVEAIVQTGATPVFVDIESDGFNLDPAKEPGGRHRSNEGRPPRSHLWRACSDGCHRRIAREHGLMVLEDCAQSFGAEATIPKETLRDETESSRVKTGSIGDAAAFSFYPTKNLGAYGDGGLIATNDAEIAERAQSLRNHATRPGRRYEHFSIGHNSRLDALQAAVLAVKLPHVERWNRMRREAAERYGRLLSGIGGVVIPNRTPGHVYHQYTIQVPPGVRAILLERFEDARISSSVFYPPIESAWPAGIGRGAGSCPRASRRAAEVVSLPIHPWISAEQQERIAAVIRSVLT